MKKQADRALIIALLGFVMSAVKANSNQNANQGETPQHEIVRNGLVSFMTTDFPASSVMPILDLSQVIKRHPDQQKFKVSWNYSVGGGSGDGHVVYDRAAHTLRFMTANVDAGQYKTEEHDLYSNVTDDLLHKLAQDVENREKPGVKVSSKAYYFDHLRAYGCEWRGQQRRWDLSR